MRAPDDNLFKSLRLWGCVSQYDTATGLDQFRAQASYEKERYWFSDGENAIFTGDAEMFEDFLEDDVFRADVLVGGSYTYDTTMGGTQTVPVFWVTDIQHVKGSC